MIATALLRSWLKRAALGGIALAVAGLVIGAAAAGSAAGSQTSTRLAGAKKALLVKADFPSGWTSQGSVSTTTSSNGSFPGEDQLASCLGVPKSVVNVNPPSATSPTFQNAAGNQFVEDNVSAFRSAKVASGQYTAIANPKVPACLTSLFQGPAKSELDNAAGKDVSLGKATVAAVSPSALVPHSSGFVVAFDVTTKGVTVPSSVAVISMVRGAYGSELTLTSVGTPISNSLSRQLASTAYGRT
ncbi:MAG TPA: hypothetical protein VMF35_15450 [Acidimicrobiales bacterium]|nr:hypothetical protein [Acidimicrobiales bacterium]